MSERLPTSEATRRLRQTYDAMACGVIVWTANGVVDANAAALRLLGLDLASLRAPGALQDLSLQEVDGSPLAADTRPVPTALRTGQELRGRLLSYTRPDGDTRTMLVDTVPLHDPHGAITQVIVSFVDVTEHRAAEAARQASEERYRRIVETAQEGIWELDAQERTVYVNRRLADLLGYTPEEMVGQPLARFLAPETRETAAEGMARRRQGHAGAGEICYRRKGGTTLWASLTANPFFDAVGRYSGSLAMVTDITARKVAEQSLQASERYFRALTEQATDLVTVFDAHGRISYVSPSYRELLGHDPVALLGTNAFALAHPDDHPAMQAAIAEVLRRPGGTARVTLRVRLAEGGWRVVEYSGVNRLDDPAVQGIVASGRDVTAQHAAEQARIHSERRFRALTEQTQDLVAVFDPVEGLRYVSPSFTRVLGYEPGALERERGHMLGLTHPEDQALMHRLLRDVLASPNDVVSAVLRERHADGTWRSIEWVGVNRSDDPAVGGILVTGRDVTARVQAEDALRHQALHDSLTDLPNRTLIQERGEQALTACRQGGQSVALLLLDLDRFKEVNDSCGHQAGDLLLQQVARRLRGVAGEHETLGRLGGDEFALLLPGADADTAQCVASRVVDALATPFVVDGRTVYVGVSVGIAVAPTHGADLPTLLRRADVAMYAAKRGRTGCMEYAPEHDQYTPERLALIADLRRAIAHGELCLHYQPKLELATGAVRGVEALVRWPHPQHGLIPPDRFIPLAEQTDLMGPLTQWVLEEALRQCAQWRRAGYLLGVNVNLSATNLREPELPATIARLLHAHGVSAADLRLEVTESALIADMARSAQVLADLAALGVRLAVDDYGTGYSSLAYLKRLPVDELKIDKSFVRDLLRAEVDATIVASTIGLGHSLGLQVVAEGAEDNATVARLAAMGCDAVQGYAVSRPLPAADVVPWLRARTRVVA